MSEYKIILTDCDGVMLDWVTAFDAWMADNGHTKTGVEVYDMSQVYGITRAESKRLVREFNQSAWMGYLKAFRDARSGIGQLYEAGYRFHVITSLSLDKKAARLRQMNLDNVFGKGVVKKLVCLDTGADKDEALEEYRDSGLYWLEDKTENALCGLKYGLKSILITHEHNKDCDNTDVIRCADWSAIIDTIID
ncbi:hypothetical protein N9R43_00870 [bacterium]|nr:hypothetical protein [bacterium]